MAHSTLPRSLGWFTLGALVALSPQLIGCNDDSDRKASPKVSDSASQSPQAAAADTRPSAQDDDKTPEKSAALAPAAQENTEGSAEQDAAEKESAELDPADGPQVKRLVIASDVENREPVALDQGQVNSPVVAFVELTHQGGEEAHVVVTFEHEGGSKVGFVELSVPGESPRYRTWARTRNIKKSGNWAAVVRTKAGEELARQSFSVSS